MAIIVMLIIGGGVTNAGATGAAKKFTVEEKIGWICKNNAERNFVYDNFKNKKKWQYVYVKSELELEGLPSVFAVIPLIESTYKPSTTSSSGAVGIWQFMPGTAKDMGLTVNKTKDERLDLERSTEAAIKYLKILKKTFGGSINLMLAAYNMGPSAIERTMNKQNAKSLPQMALNSQTHNYISKFWAYAAVINGGCRN